MQTLLRDIHTARVFIPAATGYTRTCRTFGINVMGCGKDLYNDFKQLGNKADDMAEMRPFYDLLRVAYGVEFSYPTVRPYVQYIDYIKSIGGGFSSDNVDVIKHLREHCNTLIIPNQEEFKEILLYYNKLKLWNAFPESPLPMVSARFIALRNQGRN